MTVARALRVCQTFPPEREVPSSMMFAITEYEPNTKHNVTAKKKKGTQNVQKTFLSGELCAHKKKECKTRAKTQIVAKRGRVEGLGDRE